MGYDTGDIDLKNPVLCRPELGVAFVRVRDPLQGEESLLRIEHTQAAEWTINFSGCCSIILMVVADDLMHVL